MTRLQASFKGVQFYVQASDASGGRRTVTHEYPQRVNLSLRILDALLDLPF